MKVVLINPLSGYFKFDPMSMPPLGLLYIASYLRSHGCGVTLVDRNAYLYGTLRCVGEPDERLLQELDEWTRVIVERESPQLIGFTMMTCQLRDVRHVARQVRQAGSNAVLVAGGYHPTCAPEAALRDIPELDIVVRGQGERAMLSLASGKLLNTVSGLSYRSSSADGNRRIESTLDQEFDRDHVLVYPPARDLIDGSYYQRPGASVLGCYYIRKPGSIITSQGCPKKCNFCASRLMESKMYFRPVDEVIIELEHMIYEDGVTALLFYDINFFLWRKRVEDLLDAFIDRGINRKIKWLACASADDLPADMLPRVREAGCVGLIFGFESASQKILNSLNKRATVEQNQMSVDACKANDIRPQSGFIIGVPGETERDIDLSLEFIAKNDLLSSLNVLLPLPGTKINRQLIAAGKLDPNDPDYWGLISDTHAPLTPKRVYSDIPFERFVEIYNRGTAEVCAPTWKTLYLDEPEEAPAR